MKANLSICSSKTAAAFWIKMLLFFGLLAAVDWILGSAIEQIHRRAPYGSNWTKENWLLDNEFDVIIFGSSRAFRHYVPNVISNET